ncbi:MAG TPA: hypothetical protein VLB89_03570 [Gaiellaceae bacterium]|nr:hypothetical protein [Gaiellaceae bacterium]
MPETQVRVSEIKAFKTRSGNTRFVLVDDEGKEYSTFKEAIAAKLPGLEGRRARITFHEQQREGFTNVYLDAVDLLEQEPADAEVDEAAWRTAMEAAPYLLSPEARDVPPRELFEKLQPFKELVAEDIEKPDD